MCGAVISGETTHGHHIMTYVFTADTPNYTFDTCLTNFDTMLQVSDSNGNELHFNDDHSGDCESGNNPFASHLETELQTGQQYKLKINGYSANSFGPFTISVSCPGCAQEDAVVIYDDGNQIHETGYALFGNWYEVLDAKAVATLPEDACNTVMNDLSGKIAVIKRGTCYFSTKIRNAQSAGALAVIILNNGRSDVQVMSCGDLSCYDIIIPAVFLDNDSALELLGMLENDPDHIYHVGCDSSGAEIAVGGVDAVDCTGLDQTTSGTCYFMPCYSWRNAECRSNRCRCRSGYYTADNERCIQCPY